MKSSTILSATALALSLYSDFASASRNKPSNAVLLSSVNTLTLRSDKKTTHRRVSAMPQLQCIGGNAKGLYEVDVMRCKNSGSDYDDDNVQWTCTASLPEEFKLGSTDVLCEGYDSPNDPYILKGSCGVEYRLVLTNKGEEKYKDKWRSDKKSPGSHGGTTMDAAVTAIFWLAFVGVLCWMLYRCVQDSFGPNRPAGGLRPGWGGGGGGGGGNDDDPPPPYDDQPPRSKPRTYGTYAPQQPRQQNPLNAWRPGFWTGAAGGAAAGYMAGNRGQNRTESSFQRARQETRPGGSWFGNGGGGSQWDNGEGSSNSRSSSGSSSSARYESTGFGSTSRR